MATHVNPVASLQPLTQDSPVRTGSGFLNCTSCTCVKLREKRECFSTIQHCSCVNNLVIIIHLSVFACLYLCLCMFVHSVFLACLVILCTVKEQVVLLFLYVCLFVFVYCEFSCLQLSLIWPSIPRSAFQQAYRGMIQKIIASINKLKMKQRGVCFIDFLVYSGSFNI